LNIVQGVRYYSLVDKEVLIVNVRGAIMNLVQSRFDVVLQIWVHLDRSSGSCLGLWFAEVLLTEQELTVKVADLDDIWVSDSNHAIHTRA
jgi:hypothetical protein